MKSMYLYKYPYRKKRLELKVWRRLSLLIILCLVVVLFRHQAWVIDNKTDEINTLRQSIAEKDSQINSLKGENSQLRVEVQVALANSTSPTLSEDGFNILVDLLFPKEAGDRYREIVTKCENSSRNPKKVHVNKNGSFDLGVSQINSRWHSERVQKIFNEDFVTAMSDSVKNMVYAAWIYEDQKNFSAWTCDESLAKR